MKNITKIILILLIFTTYISCDDKLELIPEDLLSDQITFSDFGLIEGSVSAMYSFLQDADTNGVPQIISDFMSDNGNFVGSFPTFQNIRDFSALSENTNATNIWLDAYENIRSANNIIVNLANVDPLDVVDLTEENKAQFIAEAKFVRAISHFDLVNLFAQPFQVSNGTNLGVPIERDFFSGDLENFRNERSTVNEVHAFIENDLLEALEDLPNSFSAERARATKGAAEALLSRLYLYRGEWENAAIRANNAISLPNFTLATNYDFYNNATSKEHIFTIVNLPDDATVGSGFDVYYIPASLGGRGDVPFTQDLIDAFNTEPSDLRLSLTLTATDAGANTNAVFTTKYADGNTQASNANVIRITEMYLTRAEANLNNGSFIGDSPLNDINLLRDRAGLANLGSLNLDDVLNERRKELCFEGHRRIDLLRNQKNLRPDNSAASDFGANKTILPIPAREMDNNPSSVQNPGY